MISEETENREDMDLDTDNRELLAPLAQAGEAKYEVDMDIGDAARHAISKSESSISSFTSSEDLIEIPQRPHYTLRGKAARWLVIITYLLALIAVPICIWQLIEKVCWLNMLPVLDLMPS